MFVLSLSGDDLLNLSTFLLSPDQGLWAPFSLTRLDLYPKYILKCLLGREMTIESHVRVHKLAKDGKGVTARSISHYKSPPSLLSYPQYPLYTRSFLYCL